MPPVTLGNHSSQLQNTQIAVTVDAKRNRSPLNGHLLVIRSRRVARMNNPGYGDLGPTISAAVADLPAASVKTMRDAWRTEADAKFGTTKSEPAKRQTAPTGAVAVDVDDRGKTDKKPWDQLSPEQQEIGRKMGAKTAEKQDAFAKNYLANKETA